MELHMSEALRVDTAPEYLQSVEEYRHQLRAELARVDAFIRTAASVAHPDPQDYPDFLFVDSIEIIDALHPRGLAH
jgi:hypothetical protein